MTSSDKNTERSVFWKQVVKLGIKFLGVFLILIFLLNNSAELFSENLSEILENTYAGVNGIIFFSSAIIGSFFCSFVFISYDEEEKRNEREEEQII